MSTERHERFRALHASGIFVMPNAWDIGSARLLVSLGFKALATTSSGHAASLGRADGHVEFIAEPRASELIEKIRAGAQEIRP